MRGVSRREALTMLGGAALLGACGRDTTTKQTAGTTAPSVAPSAFASAASCTVTPEQTEGPYYIDVDKIRSDIREDRDGVRLRVAARILDADGCTPVKDAVFEIWHCDASGDYSGFGNAPGESRYLRGGQVTNADGIATITTIYPGFYQGRTVHIHAKVAISNNEVLTTQLYFDDALSDEVFKAQPYAAHGERGTRNTDDGIYRAETTLTVSKDGDGYLGLVTIGVRA